MKVIFVWLSLPRRNVSLMECITSRRSSLCPMTGFLLGKAKCCPGAMTMDRTSSSNTSNILKERDSKRIIYDENKVENKGTDIFNKAFLAPVQVVFLKNKQMTSPLVKEYIRI